MVIGSKQHTDLKLTLSVGLVVIPWSSRGHPVVIPWVAIGHHKVYHEDKPVDKPVDNSPSDR